MAAPNFVLMTELATQHRRDFPLADSTLIQPNSANPVLDGEFLEIDTAYKAARLPENAGHTAVGATKEGANMLVFPVHTERGRTDTQSIGKVNLLYWGPYEAETKIITVAGLAVGDALTVQNVTFGGLTRRGLAKIVGTGVVVVGYVSRIVGTTIRFVHFVNEYRAA